MSEDVFARRLENVLKASWQDVLKKSWGRLENVLKTSWRPMAKTNVLVLIKTSSEDEDKRRLQDVFKTSSSRRMFAGSLLSFFQARNFFSIASKNVIYQGSFENSNGSSPKHSAKIISLFSITNIAFSPKAERWSTSFN